VVTLKEPVEPTVKCAVESLVIEGGPATRTLRKAKPSSAVTLRP
jgi:hypothetical protein